MNIQPPSSPHQHNEPPHLMPVLSDELIEEILSLLPVKDLVRAKCVCKSWNTFITNPNFVNLHLQRSSRNPHLALTWENIAYRPHDWSVIPFSVSRLIENPSVTIDDPHYQLDDKNCHALIGSCNGLWCLLGYSFSIGYRENWFCLWNPATRSISEKLGTFRTRCKTLDFAFGFDNSTGTYKVVAYHLNGKFKKKLNAEDDEASQRSEVKVFTVGDNSWRNIQSFPVVPLKFSHEYLRGTLNWLALRNHIGSYYIYEDISIEQFVIVSLDLATETYIELLLPRGFDEVPQNEPMVGVLMDSLCISHDFRRTHLIIWQMKEFGVEESWTQLLRIPYHDLQLQHMGVFELCYLPMVPLWLSENAEIVLLATATEGQSILYNMRDNRVERTRFTNEEIHWVFAKSYVESLVSPQ